jgi:hypothetical protein
LSNIFFLINIKIMFKKVLVFLCLLTTTLNIASHAAYPDLYSPYDKYLDVASPRTYDVYFPYGNQIITKDLENISASIAISKESLELDINSVNDYFLTDELVTSNPNFPKTKVLDCSLIPKYRDEGLQKDKVLKGIKVPPQFLSKKGISKFGPQSQTDTSSLKAGATGCIGMTLKVNSVIANGGDIVEVTFNQNVNMSRSFDEVQRPGLSTLSFIISDNKSKCDNSKGEVYINDKCRPKCEINQSYNALSGDCELRKKICNDQEDTINGNCFQKCIETFVRDNTGICKDPNDKSSIDNNPLLAKANLAPYFLFTGLVIVLTSIALFVINRKNRHK